MTAGEPTEPDLPRAARPNFTRVDEKQFSEIWVDADDDKIRIVISQHDRETGETVTGAIRITAAARAAIAADPNTEIIRIDEILGPKYFEIVSGKYVFSKVIKGHGEAVHIADVFKGRISGSPVCGSGTCTIGTKREFTARVSYKEVTCKKCLALIEKIVNNCK